MAVKLSENGVYYSGEGEPVPETAYTGAIGKDAARENTAVYNILRAHDISGGGNKMKIRFDAMLSHDITYVNIIQSARAGGLKKFDMPYALTNCHNSLCAVGGTINEDDHAFGLSAAEKYGGIYVAANQAVIHQYAREKMAFCGGMILGSDSHTRYGAYGTMGVGEGGPELVKQLLGRTWDIDAPQVILVWLKGEARHGVGPHDVALALCGEVFKNGYVKNKILEFAGPALKTMSADFRIGIDVMTTEAACLSSVWHTDDTIKKYYETVGRAEDYKKTGVSGEAYYDGMITIDLDKLKPMIALPYHPSETYTIEEFNADSADILRETEKRCASELGRKVDLLKCLKNGRLYASQGIIGGCAGGMYENIREAAAILKTAPDSFGSYSLSVYPASVPISTALINDGTALELMKSGAVIKPAFCGPCFGAGDTPADGTVSLRHTTRNFANREGAKPGDNQSAFVVLTDARSIAASAVNGGKLTSASDIDYEVKPYDYIYDDSSYKKRCYYGFGSPKPDAELVYGPNITDWPKFYAPEKNLLLKLCAVIRDSVTTTDELIPSGETSSLRSNPEKLSQYALSRRVPEYVGRSKEIRALEAQRREGNFANEITEALAAFGTKTSPRETTFASAVFAVRPGDGSAREQAASCQRVLGGMANIAVEYATKRYRSNLINWGIFPFVISPEDSLLLSDGAYILVENARVKLEDGEENYEAKILSEGGEVKSVTLRLNSLTDEERRIMLEGCLINYYSAASLTSA